MIRIITVPAFHDNYLWLFHHPDSTDAYAVDPGDAAAIESALQAYKLHLKGILVTHHHADHIGGIPALVKHRDIPVYGPLSKHIPDVTHPLSEGDELQLPGPFGFQVLAVPGHTLDHIAYHEPRERVLFCGDTLFAAGCGRMFEGNPRQMQASLQKLAELPPQTAVYCAHEYTTANLGFASAVEPDNRGIQDRVEATRRLRRDDKPSVPSTIAQELQTNPFLRVKEPTVVAAASRYTGTEIQAPADVFAALRSWKDNF